ncbi:MAG: hypothetical protein AAB426_10715 [Myxococcota bacterium]
MSPLLLTLVILDVAAQATPPALVTVTVDVRELDATAYEAIAAGGLYKSLLVRLVEDQLAFVDASAAADITVTLRHRVGGPLEIGVTTAVSRSDRTVPLPARGDEDGQLAVLHAVLEMVREARVALLPATAPEPPASAVTPSPSLLLTASSRALLLWSDRWGSPLWDLAGSTRWHGLDLLVGGVVSAPLGVAAALRVREWGLFGGLRTRHPGPTSWLDLQAELTLGFWQTRYRYTDAAGVSDAGAHLDPLVAGRLTLAAQLSEAWRLGWQAGGIFTLYEHAHRTTQRLLWRSWPLRPFVGLEISCDY